MIIEGNEITSVEFEVAGRNKPSGMIRFGGQLFIFKGVSTLDDDLDPIIFTYYYEPWKQNEGWPSAERFNDIIDDQVAAARFSLNKSHTSDIIIFHGFQYHSGGVNGDNVLFNFFGWEKTDPKYRDK